MLGPSRKSFIQSVSSVFVVNTFILRIFLKYDWWMKHYLQLILKLSFYSAFCQNFYSSAQYILHIFMWKVTASKTLHWPNPSRRCRAKTFQSNAWLMVWLWVTSQKFLFKQIVIYIVSQSPTCGTISYTFLR